MKIYFNRKPVQGPWGGGSKILSAIVDECIRRGHSVFFEEDLFKNVRFDVALCVDPRYSQKAGDYDDLLRKCVYASTPLVQRIGDLGTHGKPELLDLLKRTIVTSDLLIFPSKWALDTLTAACSRDISTKSTIIPNAPLSAFARAEKRKRAHTYPIKLVTHHWSDNHKKGFDTYQFLSDYSHDHRDFFNFTFIGRKPHNTYISNHIRPLNAQELVVELSKHDIYVTASKEEAGANHVLEAIALGLPVLYHSEGGSIPEYASSYGIEFTRNDDIISTLKSRLDELISMNDATKRKTLIAMSDMSSLYVDSFERIT